MVRSETLAQEAADAGPRHVAAEAAPFGRDIGRDAVEHDGQHERKVGALNKLKFLVNASRALVRRH